MAPPLRLIWPLTLKLCQSPLWTGL